MTDNTEAKKPSAVFNRVPFQPAWLGINGFFLNCRFTHDERDRSRGSFLLSDLVQTDPETNAVKADFPGCHNGELTLINYSEFLGLEPSKRLGHFQIEHDRVIHSTLFNFSPKNQINQNSLQPAVVIVRPFSVSIRLGIWEGTNATLPTTSCRIQNWGKALRLNDDEDTFEDSWLVATYFKVRDPHAADDDSLYEYKKPGNYCIPWRPTFFNLVFWDHMMALEKFDHTREKYQALKERFEGEMKRFIGIRVLEMGVDEKLMQIGKELTILVRDIELLRQKGTDISDVYNTLIYKPCKYLAERYVEAMQIYINWQIGGTYDERRKQEVLASEAIANEDETPPVSDGIPIRPSIELQVEKVTVHTEESSSTNEKSPPEKVGDFAAEGLDIIPQALN